MQNTKRLVGYKFRIYPTEDQKAFFAGNFGCCRFIYNHFLRLRQTAYERFGVKATFLRLKREIPILKKMERYAFLKSANSQSLQEALSDLENAYQRFFKGLGEYPKYRKKSGRQAFTVPQTFCLKRSKRGNWYLTIPKLGSGIKVKVHRSVVGKLKQLTISKNPSGKYYASFNCEVEGIIPTKKASYDYGAIDLGLKSFLVTDRGEKIDPPKFLRKLEKKLIASSRELSRKKKGSSNRNKARLKVAKIHEKIANQRKNFLHQESFNVVIENQVTYIEDLLVKGLVRNRCLSKSFSDGSLGEFTRMLIYKAEWRGRVVQKIGRFEPSSKRCSACDVINEDLKLCDREWECGYCHTFHDRDINAAKNILEIGLQMSLGKDLPKVRPVERQTSVFSQMETDKLLDEAGSGSQVLFLRCSGIHSRE